MIRLQSFDWPRLYEIPEPTSSTFFMEGYTGPACPIPPPSLLQVPAPSATQSAPPALPPQEPSLPPVSKPKQKPHQKKAKAGPKPEEGSKPVVGSSNLAVASSVDKPSIAPQAPKGKKRKADSMVAGPKKICIVSQEFIEDSDEETPMSKSQPRVEPMPKPKSRPQVFVEIAPPSSQSEPRVDKEIQRKPPSKSQRRVGSAKPSKRLVDPAISAERLQRQNAAIEQGKYQLATTPCETCSRRLNRSIVPCAMVTSGKEAACFTCSIGKTYCNFSGRKIKDEEEGEVKIGRKRVKKTKAKQDVKMAEVNDGGPDAQMTVDLKTTGVGQSTGKGKQKLVEMSEGESFDFDVEMADLSHGEMVINETEAGITSRPDKGKARATPAIVIEPPTPTPVKISSPVLAAGMADGDAAMSNEQGKDHRHIQYIELNSKQTPYSTSTRPRLTIPLPSQEVPSWHWIFVGSVHHIPRRLIVSIFFFKYYYY